ncbi:hypothetical protein E3P99_02241 [Wallemia hederae]|uniref:histone acetyltransferase n=1 Tax=Wallemia hederae TaxID=1540922 RepID=A0A4T0FLG6_9BASI|nr:hypothetical protein E3P99_02241 [Wallemia hederae]
MVANLQDALNAKLSEKLSGKRDVSVVALVSSFTQLKQHLFPFSSSMPNPPIKKILIAFAESGVLGSAIEIHLFKLADRILVYVSKVDSTGFGSSPSPISIAVECVLDWAKASFRRDIHLHIFARAQNAYIFPNSEKNGKKRVLSDTQLQRWWKNTLDELDTTRKWLFLPGFTQDEATSIIKCDNGWVYGNPHQSDADLKQRHLSSLIPYFEDDPKSRFLDELANSTEALDGRALKKPRRESNKEEDVSHKQEALDRTSIEEFWERLGYRQECASGRVTGFFFLQFAADEQPRENVDDTETDSGIAIELFHRIHDLLTNSEFITQDSATSATSSWIGNIKSLIDDPDIYVTTSVKIDNPSVAKKTVATEPVKAQVLTVRKKKRPASAM